MISRFSRGGKEGRKEGGMEGGKGRVFFTPVLGFDFIGGMHSFAGSFDFCVLSSYFLHEFSVFSLSLLKIQELRILQN